MSNTTDLENAYVDALHAEGSALKENEKYLDSIQGRIDLFTNSVQTMWSNALDDDAVKLFVNIGTQLVKFVDNLGLIKTLVISIGTYLIKKNFNGDLFDGLFGDKTQSMSQIKSTMESLKKARDDAAKSLIGDEGNKFKQKKLNQAESTLAAYEKSMGPELQKYNNLIEQQKIAQENFNAAQHEFIKATRDGVDTTTLEAYGNNVKNAENELKNVEIELKKVEIQADATGTAGMTAGQKIKTGFKTVGKAVLQFGKELLKSMATMYLITTVLEFIRDIGELAIDSFNDASETPKALQDKFEELNNELSNCKSELNSLESELKTTQDQIDELMSSGKLTFTEQEELDRLRDISAELKNQITLKKSLQESLQQGTNAASINATNKYLNTSFSSDKTKTERQEEGSEKWGKIGKYIGLAAGAIIAGVLAIPTGGLSVAAVTTALPAIGVGAMIGGTTLGGVGKVVGSAVAGVDYDTEETVNEAISHMAETRNSLIKARDEALAAYTNNPNDEKVAQSYEDAETALTKYDETMAKHISQIQQNYNAMAWTEDPNTQEAMRKQADLLDKYNIDMGADGAKSNAIERIFGGKEASLQLKNIDKQIKEAVKSGEEIDFYEMFNSDALKDTKERFKELGISITDLKYYYLDWKEAEEETENSTYDTVKTVSALTSGIKSLKDAFSEFDEQGLVSADTLVELYDTFGSLDDAWDNYIDVMATGTASTKEAQEATEELLEAFINQRLEQGPIKDMKEYLTLLGQLQSLGVSNPKGYIDALQRTSMISGIGKDIVNQEKELEELEKKYKNEEITEEEYNSKKANLQKTQEDYIKQYEEEYGITLSAEERLAIEKAITAEKTKQAATTAEADANTNIEAQKARDQAKEDLDNAKAALKAVEQGSSRKVSEVGRRYQRNGQVYWEYNGKYYLNGEEQVSYADPNAVESAQATVDAVQKVYDDAKKNLKLTPSVDVDAVQEGAKDAADDLQKTFDDLGLTIEIELAKSNNAVDNAQSIFDTLASAQKEYNENGYITADTLQSLLELEPKYLALLYDENGNLNLNKDRLYDVARAKLADLELSQQKALWDNAVKLSLEGSTEALREQIEVMEQSTANAADYVEQQAEVVKANLATRVSAGEMSQGEADAFLNGLISQSKAITASFKIVRDNLENTWSSSGNTAASETESALERLQKRYERQISNLDNQQTYLQNEVNRLEAERQGISKQYYEDQIAIEQQKLSLYQQERSELLGLLNSTTKGIDEWYDVADALWSVEHNIQEATLNMIEFRQSIIDLYKTAFDDLANAHSNKDDFLSDQQNYIDKYLELLDLQGEVASASGYQEQIAAEQKKMANNVAQLNNLRELLADGMSTGYIKEGSEEWIDMQDQIREVEAAILDNKIALEEYNNELENLAVEAFNLVRDAFSNKDDFFTTQQDYIEGYIDYLEAIGVDAPEAIYEKLIEIEQEKRKNTLADLVDARQGFKDIEAKGYTAADEEWQDAYSQITELEKKIQDSDIAMAQWEQTIRELNFDKFDRFISRLDDLNSEIEHLRGLMDNEDVAFEDGTWTEEGITSLGLLYQQMQLNQQKSQEYAKKIDELNEEYAKGSMQEQEYYEQLQELKEGQWDAIEAYEDVKNAIVDMEEARIDMVEKGINKEIDAYQELIDLKKKELESERDLYEFKKDIEDKTKNIASLERRIASLSGSTNASDIAERRDLMAQLREEQEGLNDTYYSHAKDSQSKAFDDEMEAYQKSREDYLEALRDTLDDTQAIIEEKISEFLLNADVGFDTLNTTADEHNLTLSDSLMKPWQNAAAESTTFKLIAEQDLQSLINEDGIMTLFGNDAKMMLEGVFTAGGSAAILFGSTVNSEIEQIKQIVLESTSPLTANLKFPWEGVIGNDGPINTFSKKAKMAIDEAVLSAQNNSEKMKNYLASPWNEATTAANTFAKRVGNILDDVVASYKKAGEEISASKVFNPPSYYSGNNGGGSGSGSGKGSSGGLKNYDLDGDGKIMHSVGALRKDATYTIASGSKDKTVKYDGIDYYYSDGLKAYFKLADGEYATYKFKANTQYYKYYAKGTLGTKKDEWAITDEYGPELTLYPGKDGTLSYMRAGTSVVPADLTKNLMQIGQMNPSELMANNIVKPTVANVATINKDVNISFDALVKADTINEDVLPKVEKMVNEQLNNFARKLNYSLKRVTS